MKRKFFKLTCLIAPLAVAACASKLPPPAPMPVGLDGKTSPAPVLASQAAEATTQPAKTAAPMNANDLPAGHRDIGEIIAQRQRMKANGKMNGELPAGHPPVSGMKKNPAATLPAGHPPLPGAATTQPHLPAGHPPLPRAGAATDKPASTQASAMGTIRVRAVQGTANGPRIGSLPVAIDLYHGEKLLDKIEAKLDEHGTFAADNIPVELIPVVRISYHGAEYMGNGEVNDGTKPELPIQVTLYEAAEEAPAWQIKMQHVMFEPSTDGVQVMEMLSVENPTDRAWIGKLGADKKRSTVAFPVPPGATDVQFAGGFHDCCTKVEGGKIASQMPLVPGTTQYRVVYKLPVAAGKADYTIATPAPVGHMMIFTPDDGSTIVAEGVESGGVSTMGGGKTRFYKAMNVAAGKSIKLAMSNITTKPQMAGTTPRGSSSGTAKVVAGAGGLAIFLVGGMFLLRKGPGSSKK